MQKPTLGVIPEALFVESRIRDLSRAIFERADAGPITGHDARAMKLWADELLRRLHEIEEKDRVD